jgi:hypothetical protein
MLDTADTEADRLRPPRPPANELPHAPMSLSIYWPVGRRFREELSSEESRGNGGYAAKNASSGALGAYRFTRTALEDIGFWKDGAWTPVSGVGSNAEFLASPLTQEIALKRYLARGRQIAQSKGLLDHVGQTIQSKRAGDNFAITDNGILAAIHGVGDGWVRRYFNYLAAHDWTSDPKDFPDDDTTRARFATVEARLRKFADLSYFRPAGR